MKPEVLWSFLNIATPLASSDLLGRCLGKHFLRWISCGVTYAFTPKCIPSLKLTAKCPWTYCRPFAPRKDPLPCSECQSIFLKWVVQPPPRTRHLDWSHRKSTSSCKGILLGTIYNIYFPPSQQGTFESMIFPFFPGGIWICDVTVGGRNPAPPGMYRTL